jgi:hypothetical protein
MERKSRQRARGAVVGSVIALLAASCGSEETEPFTAAGHGTVAVSDGRDDTDAPEIDIVRGRLTLGDGLFVGKITTVKPVDSHYDHASAIVNIEAGGEDWSISASWVAPNESRDASTTCEAIKDIDFEHPHACQARFDGRVATITFEASMLRKDESPEVNFSTEKAHDSDIAPNDNDDGDVRVELVVVE